MTTPHGPRERAATARPRVARAEFPTVLAFVRGYLHEDLAQEHGTAARAARAAFEADCSADERLAFEAERQELWARLDGHPLGAIRDVLTGTFGSAWVPSDLTEIHALLTDD